MILVNQYSGPPGINVLVDAALVNVTILKVTREGKVFTHIPAPPTGTDMNFSYNAAAGRITFSKELPFISYPFEDDTGNNKPEKLKVIYKV